MPQPTRVVVKGISKQLVGETAAIIRKQRPPEPYKGKGIRYEGEYVAAQGREARMTVLTKENRRLKRRRRVRAKIAGTATRPRISVFRSNRGISAQLVDDVARPHARRRRTGSSPSCAASAKPSATHARRRRCSPSARRRPGIDEAVFDRGGYQYHGHVQSAGRGDPRGAG